MRFTKQIKKRTLILNTLSRKCHVMSVEGESHAERIKRELDEMQNNRKNENIPVNELNHNEKKKIRKAVTQQLQTESIIQARENAPSLQDILKKIDTDKCISCGDLARLSKKYDLLFGKVVDHNYRATGIKLIQEWSYMPVAELRVKICYKCIFEGKSSEALKTLIEVKMPTHVSMITTHPKDVDILIDVNAGQVIRHFNP